jgi:hypothetical protein
MDAIPSFPAGVDPVGNNMMSYGLLMQQGQGMESMIASIAALGGIGAGAPGVAPAEGGGNTQALLAQSMMQYFQYINQIWMQLAMGTTGTAPNPTAQKQG